MDQTTNYDTFGAIFFTKGGFFLWGGWSERKVKSGIFDDFSTPFLIR
jgi:hypothetical protein